MLESLESNVRIVGIGDTHCQMNKVNLPEGDVLVHSGDLTYRGTIQEISRELKYLQKKTRNFKTVAITCGNHDFLGELNPSLMQQMCKDYGIEYFCDEAITIQGKKFYFSPYTPDFYDWAFMLPRGEALKNKWAQIPDDTNVLVTHGMPFGILDETYLPNGIVTGQAGCYQLLDRIKELKNLELYFGGHLHGGGGEMRSFDHVFYYNTAVCDDRYIPCNPIHVVDYV